MDRPTLVTIGVPTYRRPELLRIALESIAVQTYSDAAVIVSDNASPGGEVDAIIEQYRQRIPNLRYVKQPKNIGSLPNFMYLLNEARSPYFMWLADDDSISPDYVRSLLHILESDADAACACGYTLRVGENSAPTFYRTSNFPQSSTLSRVLRFVWRTDDYFFYGLHRTEILRGASFRGYWWPNAEVVANWCYVFLLDVVLAGKVVFRDDKSVYSRVKVDSRKHYTGAAWALREAWKTIMLRINVHCLYAQKVAAKISSTAAVAAAAVSTVSLLREFSVDLLLRLFRKTNRTLRRRLGMPVPTP